MNEEISKKKNSVLKKCGIYIRTGMFVIATLAFFGLFYPDLCMLNDTCKVVVMTENGEEEIQIPQGSELYYSLLQAKPQDIKIKSRLLEAIESYFERNKQKE